MNVLIITEEDMFYVRRFFTSFLARAATQQAYTITGMSILAPFNKRSTAALARQMWSFFGPYHFMRIGLLYVLKKATGATVQGCARRYGIPVYDTARVNEPAFVHTVKDLDTDVIVSIAAPQLFKKPILEAAPKGCINSHSSLLPENKGMMPVFWAMYKQSPCTGVTIHYMDEDFDNGNIIMQEKVPIDEKSLHKMIIKTKDISARLMDESLHAIHEDRV
jgi:methionyl-tRNA formyltransferase